MFIHGFTEKLSQSIRVVKSYLERKYILFLAKHALDYLAINVIIRFIIYRLLDYY